MPQTPQTYANHTRFFPLFHFVVGPIFLLNMLNAIRHVYQTPTRSMAWALVVAVGFVLLALASRAQALAVQDRVIRLEMRLRLQGLLPPDMQAQIYALTPRQLVALRFASDEELPALCRDVLAGTCSGDKAIKQRVKNWQGDYLRA